MKHPQLSAQRSDYRSSSMPPLRRALFGGTPELIPGWEDGMAPGWFALAPAPTRPLQVSRPRLPLAVQILNGISSNANSLPELLKYSLPAFTPLGGESCSHETRIVMGAKSLSFQC